MKAIIMAGGEGTRLRPLTCDIPKPMARLCGRPTLEYILDLLERHGFTEAAVTVRYLPHLISSHFPDGRYGGLRLSFVEEDKPLGTAGSVKNAWGGGDVLVISGDAMCDFDLGAAVRFHRERGAAATILAKQVGDPREYGLIDCHDDGRINAFIEKPAFSQAVSDLANTGIYLLSSETLSMIPDGESYDFAKDLFPKLLAEGKALFCKEDSGYWCDIGDLDTYIQCQRDMLSGKVDCRIHGVRDFEGNVFAGEKPPRSCRITAPSYIGRDVTFEENVTVEQSVIDDGCYIGEDVRVTGSIVLAGAYLSHRAKLTGSLVCAGASVKTGAMLFEGSTIGSGAVIGERCMINPGVKIWNGKTAAAGEIVTEHRKISDPQRSFFTEDGISGEVGVELTPEFMARLGCAIGSVKPDARIAVGGSAHSGISVLKDALCAGIQSTGARVMDFGESFRARFEYDMAFSSSVLGVFISGGTKCGIRMFGKGGLPAERDIERGIEILLSRGEFIRCPGDRLGDRVVMTGMDGLYKAQLLRFAIHGLGGLSAQVRSRSMYAQNTLRDVLYRLGCDVESGFTLELSSQGDKVRLLDDKAGYIPHHKILAWCAIRRMERGEDVALPFDAPRFLDEVAARHGVKLHRYYDCPADSSDQTARKIAAFQMWSRDGLMQAVMLMSIIKEEGGLQNMLGRCENFGMASRTIQTQGSPAGLIRHLNREKSGQIREGIVLTHERGIVLIKPLKRGTGIRILAEAASMEIADEICADVEGQIGIRN
ncbi:MAG: sugar phosphate nucleotidyltransferase [Oscillospiraceae bacterium]|nr:sugar phosphate nucleotidyltransferase [Oscillospiraceae bacterium]